MVWNVALGEISLRALRISAPYSHSFTYNGCYIVLILIASINTPPNNEGIARYNSINKNDDTRLKNITVLKYHTTIRTAGSSAS
jgi:hypothetical protein